MRALVTGGAGFLGSSLVDHLLAAGLEVDGLDDLSQGQMSNLQRALKSDRFKFHLGSVLDERQVDQLVEKADLVFHLAALVGMRTIIDASERTLQVNATGTFVVLRACERYDRRCLVFSSSDVYGPGDGRPFSESHTPDPGKKHSARWFYAVAKICSERAALAFHRRSGLGVTVVRPFNATGPRQRASSGMVVPAFVRCALQGDPLPVHGTGEQIRTFVAVDDLIQQVTGLAMDDASIGRIINVGGEEEFSIYRLALMVKEVLGSRSRVKRVPYEKVFGQGYEDVVHRRPDLSLLESMGHYHRLRPIREVILEMAAHLSERHTESRR